MNTQRSEKKAAEFLKSKINMKRKVQVCEGVFKATPDKVFRQLCPTRELDWIEGWECDLVYSTTGYAEADCIFRTSTSNVLGEGLWVFTAYEANEKVEIVRIINDSVAMHMRIHLVDNKDGTTTGTWTVTVTALKEAGNTVIDMMPGDNVELQRAIDGLVYFLEHGELLTGKLEGPV